MLGFEAVVLACGIGQPLRPLASVDGMGCMLHVGLRPMISYPLMTVQKAGASKVVVVVSADSVASSVRSWINNEPEMAELPVQVVVAQEDCSSVDGLRLAMDHLTSSYVVVLGASVVTNVALRAVLMSHFVSSAEMTVMLNRRKSSASAQTKPGRAPENVDYIALNEDQTQLLFFSSNPSGTKDLKIPWSILKSNTSVSLTTSFVDTHAYVLSRGVLNLIDHNQRWSDIQLDVIPFLVNRQFRKSLSRTLNVGRRMTTEESDPVTSTDGGVSGASDIASPGGMKVSSFIVGKEEYCAAIESLQDFADVNKELAAPELCSTLVGLTPSKNGNFIHDTVVQGNRATIATGCIVWEGTVLGDKTSVKRTVIGKQCRLAGNVKVINSVILDNVTIGEGSHIQNSIIGAGCVIGSGVQLKECQVGPNYTVADSSEHKGEALPDLET